MLANCKREFPKKGRKCLLNGNEVSLSTLRLAELLFVCFIVRKRRFCFLRYLRLEEVVLLERAISLVLRLFGKRPKIRSFIDKLLFSVLVGAVRGGNAVPIGNHVNTLSLELLFVIKSRIRLKKIINLEYFYVLTHFGRLCDNAFESDCSGC